MQVVEFTFDWLFRLYTGMRDRDHSVPLISRPPSTRPPSTEHYDNPYEQTESFQADTLYEPVSYDERR